MTRLRRSWLYRQAAPHIARGRHWMYDKWYGVETATPVSVEELEASGPALADAVMYDTLSGRTFRAIFRDLAIRYEDYSFFDLGSGKGKAVLAASGYPFRRIVGVEFSPKLHAISERNIANYRGRRQKCRQIDVRCGDAAQVAIEDLPAVVYMFNPFRETVMRAVLQNIARAVAANPGRDVRIVYVTPALGHFVEETGLFEPAVLRPWYTIYGLRVS